MKVLNAPVSLIPNLADLENQLRQKSVDQVPKGFKTSRQLSEEWGISMDRTTHKVGEFVAAGLMERKVFRVAVGQVCRPVPHYAVKG